MAHLQNVLVGFEPLFVLAALGALIKSGHGRRLPAFRNYLALSGASGLFLNVLIWLGLAEQSGTPSCIYFVAFWLRYIGCAVLMFFVCQEVFRKVMEPVPGLRRLGLVAFRWVWAVTLVVGFGVFALPAVVAPSANSSISSLVASIALDLGRCVSILELSLLAFLALTIHTFGRTYRSRLFGVAVGFGLQAGADLMAYALYVKFPHLDSPVNLGYQIAISAVLLTWTTYFLVPEPEAERRMVILAPTSVVARWNGLASGIGQAPALAPATAPTGFFLQDIEGVVDRVLARNPVAVSGR